MVVIIYDLADDMSPTQAIQPSPRWGELERGFQESWREVYILPSVDNLRLLLWISVDNYAFRVAYCV